MIRVLIAEDQAMVRGALAALLTTEGDFEITGDAPNGRAALDLARTLLPDVLLTDIEMPELTGLELAAEIKRLHLPTKIVILTTFARAGYLRRRSMPASPATCSRTRPLPRSLTPSAESAPAPASSILNSPPKPGPKPTPSRIANARCSAMPARAEAAPKSPDSSTSPRAPCATISPRPSANSAPPIAPKPPASPP